MTDHEPTSVSPPVQSAAGIVPPQIADATPSESPAPRDKWDSAELLGDRIEILIQHGTETYRLRRTRQDKLILYK
jgi:hemin uptake protein HemP